MMNRISSTITRLYLSQIDARGLAFFRILYFINLFLEVLRVFNYRQLIFDNIPFVASNEIAITAGLILWLTVILFLIAGMYTRFFSIVNYLLTVIFFGAAGSFSYHMYYLYTSINLLMLFLPVSRVLSIDRLFVKWKYSSAHYIYQPPSTVNKLSYLIPVFIGIGLVYYDSILYKLISNYWMHGLGMWLPSSLPMITWVNASPLLNGELLIKVIGYLTLIFECVFIFLFWHKKFRWPFFFIGLGLHAGILYEYPIPYFAIGVIALYLLMIPVSFWKKIKLNRKENKTLTFYYDAECPLCIRTVILLKHFDIFTRIRFVTVQSAKGTVKELNEIPEAALLNDIYSINSSGKIFSGYNTYRKVFKAMIWTFPFSMVMYLPGISHIGRRLYSYIAANRTNTRCTDDTCGYTPPVVPSSDSDFKLLHNLSLHDLKLTAVKLFLFVAVILQFIVSLNAGLIKNIRRHGDLKGTFADTGITAFSASVKTFIRPFTGIANHPVFMDAHFKNYNHIIAIRFNNNTNAVFLPVIDERGMPGKYLQGATYVNWTFRVNSADIDQAKLSDGILRYTAFWAGTNGLLLNDLHFDILVKKIDNYQGWEMDFLNKQIAKPWQKAGDAEWENGIFICKLEELEKI
jgi:predicted DCC family thiol-disulfide oxidoreductase YuxK